MKKLLLLVLSLTLSMTAFTSCDFLSGLMDELDKVSSSESSQPVAKTYKVTFEQEGESDIVKTVKEGESLTDIPTPKGKTGYDVVWSVMDFTNITKDITGKAIATAKTYTITYDVNGGDTLTSSTQTVTFDKNETLVTPTRENYNFAGWHLGTEDGNAVESGVWTIAEDVTLVASWQEIVVVKYTVSFVQDGKTIDTVEVVEGGSVADKDIPALTQKTGYKVEWDRTDFTNITENITVGVKETPNVYTITYDANGGTVTSATQKVTYDSTPTLATPTKENHTFVSWTYNGNAVSGKWTIAEDVTLVAQWQEIVVEKYTVSFVQDGKTIDTVEVVAGGSVAEEDIPALTQKTGYKVEWDRTDFTNITENITVGVKETPNVYTITYDANGGTVALETQQVTYDSTPTLAIPTKEGYTFVSWTYNGNAVSGKWTIAENVTLVASWTKVINTYSIIFKQAGQQDVTFEGIEEGSAFTNIPNPVAVKGYTIEWNEDELAKLQNVTEALIINAVITPKKYTVTVDKNDGSDTTTQTVTYNTSYDFGKPTREGYTFIGWTLNGTAITETGTWTHDLENITVKAQWEAETYTVKLILDGGSAEWTEKDGFVYGTAYTLPTPTKKGYKFLGWKYNGTLIDQSGTWTLTSTSGTIQLEAAWEDTEENWTQNY